LIVDLDDMSIMDVDKEGKILLERDYGAIGVWRSGVGSGGLSVPRLTPLTPKGRCL
jgi:hypothetical protein